MNDLTQRGIAALKSGDRTAARQMLGEAVKQNPNDVLAWLWLSGAAAGDDERTAILRHVLKIDPGNQTAERGLSQILGRQAQAGASAAPPPKSAGGAAAAGAVETQAQPPAVEPAVETNRPAVETIRPVAEPAPPTVATIETAAAQPPAAEAAPAQPVIPTPAANAAPDQTHSAARRRRKETAVDYDRLIFRTRPSLVQALFFFWLFLFGTLAIGFILYRIPGIPLQAAFLATITVGLVFELIVVLVVIRRLRTRYELTTGLLTVPFRDRRVMIPISDILSAECRQSLSQQILSIGDVLINAVVAGELARLRLRDIPECKKRTEQIVYLVQEKDE